MKKPFGQRDGPTEPLSQDAADTEDGPTLRVYVPEQGEASQLPSFDMPAESLTAPRWAPALPSFDETTSSGFYETMTRQRGDLYEDAATLEKRPEPELPRFPTGGGAWQPAPSSPAWPHAAPDRPLPSAPLPLLPPRSAPFPLVPRAPSAPPPPLRVPIPSSSGLPAPSRPRPSRPPPAPSRPPPGPSRPMPSRPPPTPHPSSIPSRPPAHASAPMRSAPRRPPVDDDPIIEVAPELAVGDGEAFHDEHALPTDVDLAPPFSSPVAASLPSAPRPRAPMTTLPGVRGRSPDRGEAKSGQAQLRHPLLAHRLRLRVTSDRTALSVAVGVFTALAVAGILSAIVFVATRDDAPTAAGAPPLGAQPATTQGTTAGAPQLAAAAPAAGAQGTGSAVCELSQPPRKLAAAILPTVPPMLSTAPGDGHVAVGFAASAYQATGLIVNADDLSSEVRLSEQTSRPVFRVTPLPHRSPVTFAIDHDDARVAGLRTVPARTPFQLGLAREDLVRIEPGREPSVIWPGGGRGGIGEPQFASIDGKGHAVALRRGRDAGEIVFGWLAQGGARDTDLVRIDVGPREVGTPALATNDHAALIVSAARGLGERWHLYGALAEAGKAAGPARRIEPSDTGGNEIAPLVIALPRSGWLLRWLEGQPGAWRVRSRVLDASLAPQGAIVELGGPDGVSEAPGAMIVRKGRVVALHQQSAGRANELWASVLRCP